MNNKVHAKCSASGELKWAMRTTVGSISVGVHVDLEPIFCFKSGNIKILVYNAFVVLGPEPSVTYFLLHFVQCHGSSSL